MGFEAGRHFVDRVTINISVDSACNGQFCSIKFTYCEEESSLHVVKVKQHASYMSEENPQEEKQIHHVR